MPFISFIIFLLFWLTRYATGYKRAVALILMAAGDYNFPKNEVPTTFSVMI